MFLSLERWYHAADILSLVHIGAFDRVHPQPGGDLAAQKRHLEEAYGADIAIIPNEHVLNLSSTQVRQALAHGGGQELVTDPVYGYIQRRGLYGVHTDLRRLTPDRAAAHRPELSEAQAHAHVLGHGAGGRSVWALRTGPMRPQAGWPPCFTTAPKSWIWTGSWLCAPNITSSWTTWSSTP